MLNWKKGNPYKVGEIEKEKEVQKCLIGKREMRTKLERLRRQRKFRKGLLTTRKCADNQENVNQFPSVVETGISGQMSRGFSSEQTRRTNRSQFIVCRDAERLMSNNAMTANDHPIAEYSSGPHDSIQRSKRWSQECPDSRTCKTRQKESKTSPQKTPVSHASLHFVETFAIFAAPRISPK
jgi:hypothetical protein